MNYGRFGALLGTLSIGNSHCKFLIYAVRNAEILTSHEAPLQPLSPQPGWIEFDPLHIWRCCVECINQGCKNLVYLDINPADIVAIGLTNQRETSVLWHRHTGVPLYNAIAWNDVRTGATLNAILAQHRQRKSLLQSVCGLPLSNCFSALKVKWMIANVAGVEALVAQNSVLFGTLDTWIMWQLTGGIEGGVHVTDVTNASRTMLMALETRRWDPQLCAFFRIPSRILPEIRSCAEVYGFVHDGPLRGVPIAGCLAEQPAALLGQMCIRNNQMTCTYDDSCSLLINTGQQIIESDNGLLSTIAMQLGPNAKPVYALEGIVANAGSAIGWLRDNLALNTDLLSNNSSGVMMMNPNAVVGFSGSGGVGGLGVGPAGIYGGGGGGFASSTADDTATIASTTNSDLHTNYGTTITTIGVNNNLMHDAVQNSASHTDVVFVPAFNGLYSPHWKHDSRGLILGLGPHTTARQITQAAYEAICFQTRELLDALTKDLASWPRLERLCVGGEFSEQPRLLQLLADLCGIAVERPQQASPSCLGAMLAAGTAMQVLTVDGWQQVVQPPADVYQPTMCASLRDLKYRRWKRAMQKCIGWDASAAAAVVRMADGSDGLDDRDPVQVVRSSIPGGLYIFTSLALVLFTQFMKKAAAEATKAVVVVATKT